MVCRRLRHGSSATAAGNRSISADRYRARGSPRQCRASIVLGLRLEPKRSAIDTQRAEAVAPELIVAPTPRDPHTLSDVLLEAFSTVTGWAKDQVELDHDLDADLGVGSLMRTEILIKFLSATGIAGQSSDERDELLEAVDRLTVSVNQGEVSLTTARAQLASARQRSAAFETALETLRRQTGWLAQVAGYHIGYAGKPREVEVSANEQTDSQALSKWLSNELGRSITIPRNLPMAGFGEW